MGNYASKIGEEIKEEIAATGSVPSTPILTPKTRVLSEFDPRSPSTTIIRTPIQAVLGCIDDCGIAENKCDSFNIGCQVPHVLLQDPRSPTCEIIRTPIVASVAGNEVYNKNLDVTRKTLTTMITPKKICYMCSHVPPKLLESSPASVKQNGNKRKSMVGVLETNLDYVETNIDDVIVKKVTIKEQILKKKESTSDFKSKYFEQKTYEDNLVPPQQKVDLMNSNKEVIVDDDGLIIQSNLVDKVLSTPKVVELTSKVSYNTISSEQEFSKKLANLIYTDEDIEVVNKQNKKQKDRIRNPLGIRNGVPKLKVSDKSRNNEFTISKIPLFKNKISTQCENTPPKSMVNHKMHRVNVAQWDSDNTLII